MYFTPTTVLAATLLAASGIRAQDGTVTTCLEVDSVIQWDEHYKMSLDMQGTLIDNGTQTCANINEGNGRDPTRWDWDCLPGGWYTMDTVTTNNGIKVEYCNPDGCTAFDINCNYASDDIKCQASHNC